MAEATQEKPETRRSAHERAWARQTQIDLGREAPGYWTAALYALRRDKLTLTAIGVLLIFADKIPWIGRLPGDILIRRKNFAFYLPIATCILLSILVTLLLRVLFRR